MPAPLRPVTPPTPTSHRLPWVWLGLLAITLAWDALGLDLPLMQHIGTSRGFALRGDALLERVMHDGLRRHRNVEHQLIRRIKSRRCSADRIVLT